MELLSHLVQFEKMSEQEKDFSLLTLSFSDNIAHKGCTKGVLVTGSFTFLSGIVSEKQNVNQFKTASVRDYFHLRYGLFA